jgi:hypothetical protein
MVPAGAEREFDVPVADLLIKNGRAKEIQLPKPTPPKLSKKAAKREARNAKLHR